MSHYIQLIHYQLINMEIFNDILKQQTASNKKLQK